MSATAADVETDTNKSTQAFITALVTGVVTMAALVALFTVIRTRFKKIYNPRSYLVPPKERSDPLPHGFLAWIPYVIKSDTREIIAKNGLDAYVFVRFLWLMVELFFPLWVVTWIILLPINAANSGGVPTTNTGLTRFNFGNVGPSQTPRYAAHLILVWIFTFYVFYLLKREYAAFVVLRQDFLMSPAHSRLPQAKTVLVTGVPKEFLNVEAMTRFCSVLPGGVKRVWIAKNLGDLPDMYDDRNKACNKLEGAETKLLKAAAKVIQKGNKKKPKGEQESLPTHQESDRIDSLVPTKKRPHHKLGFLGLFGKKVDTIHWAREEIATKTREIEEQRTILASPEGKEKYPAESAAFIQFNEQMAAHMFAQCLAHHAPLRMSARYLEVAQEDVIWSNLSINPYQARLRYVASWAMTLGLIIGWSFPVAFVGLLSNVSALCTQAPWLAWLCTLPVPINGIIQGALPPIALAVLFILLPIVLRLFARFEGIPLHTAIELSLMTRYFLFKVIHGFLIVTLASGLVNAIPKIASNPGSAVTILATQLPAASTFFLTYFVTTSFAGAAMSLVQLVPLAIYYVKLFILGSTPRSVFNIKYQMAQVQWGTLWPNMTLLTVIGLAYSIIAPLICGFACVSFALFWFVYKYLFTLVIDTPPETETGGLFYPKALSHIFVGLYIELICLAGLFFLAQDENQKNSAIPQGALTVVLIVFVVFVQLTLNSGYGPLIDYLPLSVAQRIQDLHHDNSRVSQPHDEKRSKGHEQDRSVYPPTGNKSDDGVPLTRPSPHVGDHEYNSDRASTESLDDNAFDHPATYEGYDTIWIPEDKHGFSRAEVDNTRQAGVDVSSDGARMNEKGTVDVSRAPPGEDWDPSQQL